METTLIAIIPHNPGDQGCEVSTATFDGTAWSGLSTISSQPGGISVVAFNDPSVVSFNNWTYMIYLGEADGTLYCAWNDGTSWYGGIPISQMNGDIAPKATHPPGIAVYRGLLMLSYVEPTDADHLVRTAWFDGNLWEGDEPISDQNGGIEPKSSLGSPAMCTFNGLLYFFYQYAGTARSCTFNGIVFEGNNKLKDQPGGISPSMLYQFSAVALADSIMISWRDRTSYEAYTANFDGQSWSGGTSVGSQPGNIDVTEWAGPSLEIMQGGVALFFRSKATSTLSAALLQNGTWSGGGGVALPTGGSTTHFYGDRVGVAKIAPAPVSNESWLSQVPDSHSLRQVALPGTHDSAAINSSYHTPYACQNQSITEQLDSGIRVLDVRLQMGESNGVYTFVTCHSDNLSSIGMNTYQSFESLMDECQAFLLSNPSEFIVMSLKVDSWVIPESKHNPARTALTAFLQNYPILWETALPTVGAMRGKILTFARLGIAPNSGIRIRFPENTPGSNVQAGSPPFSVYIQDQFKGLPLVGSEQAKCDLFTEALIEEGNFDIRWNFASATWFAVYGVYIGECLLNFFGQNVAAARTSLAGVWTMMDYPNNSFNSENYGSMTLTQFIIDSNFGYPNYPGTFTVIEDGHGDL